MDDLFELCSIRTYPQQGYPGGVFFLLGWFVVSYGWLCLILLIPFSYNSLMIIYDNIFLLNLSRLCEFADTKACVKGASELDI